MFNMYALTHTTYAHVSPSVNYYSQDIAASIWDRNNYQGLPFIASKLYKIGVWETRGWTQPKT